MRTEVKAGLLVGLLIIGIGIFYVVRQAGDGTGEVDEIPFNVPVADLQGERGAGDSPAARQTPPERPRTQTEIPRQTERLASRDQQQPNAPANTSREELPPVVRRDQPLIRPGDVATAPPATPTTQSALEQLRALRDEQPDTAGPQPQTPETQPPTIGQGPIVARDQEEPASTGLTPIALPPRPSERETPLEPSTRVREAPRPEAAPRRYTVQRGDTLTSIARAEYGEDSYWLKIREANPDLANPDQIKEGQVIFLPPKEAANGQPAEQPRNIANRGQTPAERTPAGGGASPAPTTATSAATYTVGEGDTLISIAREVLGDGSRWPEIYQLNRDKLQNPDVVYEGMVLRLPPRNKPAETPRRR